MLQKNIESLQAKKKREAVRSVLLFSLLPIGCAVCLGSMCFIPDLPKWAVILFAVLAAISVIPLGMAVFVLKQRFKEIQEGELDAARQY